MELGNEIRKMLCLSCHELGARKTLPQSLTGIELEGRNDRENCFEFSPFQKSQVQ